MLSYSGAAGVPHARVARAGDLGFGRIVVSEIEVPIIFVDLA